MTERYIAIENRSEALLAVLGIRDIWVKNYRDAGYLREKLMGYGILNEKFGIWNINVGDTNHRN